MQFKGQWWVKIALIAAIMIVSSMAYADQVQQIRQLEMQRYEAMAQGKLALLDTMLDDNMIFTHANGHIDTKETFMNILKTKVLEYKSIETQDIQIRDYGTCGVVTGLSLLHIKVRNKDKHLRLRFTTVYVKQKDQWRVVAYQSTQAPALEQTTKAR